MTDVDIHQEVSVDGLTVEGLGKCAASPCVLKLTWRADAPDPFNGVGSRLVLSATHAGLGKMVYILKIRVFPPRVDGSQRPR